MESLISSTQTIELILAIQRQIEMVNLQAVPDQALLKTLKRSLDDRIRVARRRERHLYLTLESLEDRKLLASWEKAKLKNLKEEYTSLKLMLDAERDRRVAVLQQTAVPAGRSSVTGRMHGLGDSTQGLIFHECQRIMGEPMHCLRWRSPNECGLSLLPVKADTALDHVGGDFLLLNRRGEYLPIDATQRDKSADGLPLIRRQNVISSSPHDRAYGRMSNFDEYQRRRSLHIRQQLEAIVERFRSSGSPLNVLEVPPPDSVRVWAEQAAEAKMEDIDRFIDDLFDHAETLRQFGEHEQARELENYARHTLHGVKCFLIKSSAPTVTGSQPLVARA